MEKTIIIVSEECHGILCAADSVKSAMRFLVADGWVHENLEVYFEEEDKWTTLRKEFGNKWAEPTNLEKVCWEDTGFYFDARLFLTETPAKQEIKEYCPRCGKFINPVFKVRQISQRVFTNSDTYKTITFEGLAAECPECREELISGFVEARNKAEFDRKKEESL